jgi:hypothetical protein
MEVRAVVCYALFFAANLRTRAEFSPSVRHGELSTIQTGAMKLCGIRQGFNLPRFEVRA